MENLKICSKCIQPNTRPGIFFNDENICGACIYEEEKKKINWSERKKELNQIITTVKEKKSDYDCAIGGYKMAYKTFERLKDDDYYGLERINKEKIAIKFECKELPTT